MPTTALPEARLGQKTDHRPASVADAPPPHGESTELRPGPGSRPTWKAQAHCIQPTSPITDGDRPPITAPAQIILLGHADRTAPELPASVQ